MSGMALRVTDEPDGVEISGVFEGLMAFNEALVGPAERRSLAVLLEGEKGGLIGFTAWGWLYVQWLFVPEHLRGQGCAHRLLEAAENEARNRGCHASWIDTFNPQALKLYARLGYEHFGRIEDFVAGQDRHFLKKSL